ncbi:MAG: TetR/AcrR family transcriptional regulator [Pseudomonadota bacterium]
MNKIKPATEDAIIEAAFQLLNETQGASLGDIAARAGVGRATLHRYYPGREDLMRALALRALHELDQAVEAATKDAETYAEGFRLSLHAIIPLANRQWFLAQEAVDADPQVAAAYAASQAELRKDIDAAKEEGVFAKDVPTVWIEEALENLTYAAWSMVRDGEATPKQAAELAWRTLRNGLN